MHVIYLRIDKTDYLPTVIDAVEQLEHEVGNFYKKEDLHPAIEIDDSRGRIHYGGKGTDSAHLFKDRIVTSARVEIFPFNNGVESGLRVL